MVRNVAVSRCNKGKHSVNDTRLANIRNIIKRLSQLLQLKTEQAAYEMKVERTFNDRVGRAIEAQWKAEKKSVRSSIESSAP